jgi:Phage Mu protein F like protein
MNATTLMFAAAALPADQARAIVCMIQSNQSTTFERTRGRLEKRFHSSLVRVLKFAKHETLRKAHRYLYTHRPIMSAEESIDHPDTNKIMFDREELKRDLMAMLTVELPVTLDLAAADTLASLGFRDPWKLPHQATLDFVARRQNLLSKVPQEIFDIIKKEITAGLITGEPLRDLAARITGIFDTIDKERATLIASTETSAAYAFASHQASVAAGVTHKKWVHSVIPKVPRPDHLAINGLIVPIDQPYPVGDPQLMYPHDENGSAEDVINCRCISIPVPQSEYEAQQNG